MKGLSSKVEDRYNRWSRVSEPFRDSERKEWCIEVRCDCGTQRVHTLVTLRSGNSKSCGCMRREAYAAAPRITDHPLYDAWRRIKNRCKPTSKDRKSYYEKGITVCERWLNSFENFAEDMSPRPEGKISIDRIDNLKGYSPENCRWATMQEQANNRSDTIMLEYLGEVRSQADWARFFNLSYQAFKYRIDAGWSIEDASQTPIQRRKPRSVKS